MSKRSQRTFLIPVKPSWSATRWGALRFLGSPRPSRPSRAAGVRCRDASGQRRDAHHIIGRTGIGLDNIIIEFVGHALGALKGLSPQPKAPLSPAFVLGDNFEHLQKNYLLRTEGGMLPRSLQEVMSGVWPNVNVTELAAAIACNSRLEKTSACAN